LVFVYQDDDLLTVDLGRERESIPQRVRRLPHTERRPLRVELVSVSLGLRPWMHGHACPWEFHRFNLITSIGDGR
jgi:hypothetical protein